MTTQNFIGKKILFANFPADGHFNPLTGVATYLQSLGADVRWYTSTTYSERLKKLQLHHYPFKLAVDVSDNNFDKAFPGRARYKTQTGKLKFDLIHAFISRGPEFYADIVDIYHEFPFDLLVADCAFTGIPYVKELMNVPVISIGVLPLIASSKDLPPVGLGMEPSYTIPGKIKQSLLRFLTQQLIFRKPNNLMRKLLDQHQVPHKGESLFDLQVKKADFLLQSGSPGFEYERSDLGQNIRFIGPLLPAGKTTGDSHWFDARLNQYRKIVLVTQGTVEKDITKILIPTLEAFKYTDTLVVATTGGSGTAQLKEKYPDQNMIIEDFIPFGDVMPYADVYVTNGGYGGVMLSIKNRLPMVVAGVHEGKNEINARVGYFKFGVNLKTEQPKPAQIRKAVQSITSDKTYHSRLGAIAEEFDQYQPNELVAQYAAELMTGGKVRRSKNATVKPQHANAL